MRISHLSRPALRVPISATEVGADPTGGTVEMAFAAAEADPEDWWAASWQQVGSTFYAQCIVGPGGTVALAPGRYDVWVRFADGAALPMLHAGSLTVD